MCTEWPTVIFDRSTSRYSGRSAGKQRTSISFIAWDTSAPESFTAGETSAPTKWNGTFMWIFWSAATRWKSMCCTCTL